MKKVALLLLVYVVCAAIGFAVPHFLTPVSASSDTESSTSTSSSSNTHEKKDGESAKDKGGVTKAQFAITSVNPEYLGNNRYRVTVEASQAPATFYLCSKSVGKDGNATYKPISGQVTPDGQFASVPAGDEEYYVYAMNADNEVTPLYRVGVLEKKVEKIANPVAGGELEKLLNSAKIGEVNAALKGRVGTRISFSYANPEEDEDLPKTYGDICTMIQTRVWSGIRVQSVGYDDAGRLNRVRIEIIR